VKTAITHNSCSPQKRWYQKINQRNPIPKNNELRQECVS